MIRYRIWSGHDDEENQISSCQETRARPVALKQSSYSALAGNGRHIFLFKVLIYETYPLLPQKKNTKIQMLTKFSLEYFSVMYVYIYIYVCHLLYFSLFIFIVWKVWCVSRSYLWTGKCGPEFPAFRVSIFVTTCGTDDQSFAKHQSTQHKRNTE